MLNSAKENGVFLLNCAWDSLQELERHIPYTVKRQIAEKRLRFYTINATKIAEDVGLSGRTSTVMQAAFFLLSPNVLPYEKAKKYLKEQLKNTFQKKGESILQSNLNAIEKTENALQQIAYPTAWLNASKHVSTQKTEDVYYERFIKPILRLEGDTLPVSAFNPDGSVPTDTAKTEKRGFAAYLPMWIAENCIQCNQCSFVCPHATIRPFVFDEKIETPFTTLPTVGKKETKFRIQVAAEYCMGCSVCADVCPTKDKALVMRPAEEIGKREAENWAFATSNPQADITALQTSTVKGSQFRQPLFEFSYACAGCGETPYIKLLTQLFGDRALIANATGCSSIYGGSAPACPYAKNKDGKGPAWASSLFEDNAEFGLGMRLACDFLKNTDKTITKNRYGSSVETVGHTISATAV
jgi:pyruvate-ferredoxin/flavodoxin oxidoreductase